MRTSGAERREVIYLVLCLAIGALILALAFSLTLIVVLLTAFDAPRP